MDVDISSLDEAYQELGLSNGATEDEVRKAHRKLAGKFHPDRNKDDPDAETKFKRINRAKQIIDNPAKELRGQGFGGGPGGPGGFGGFGNIHVDFSSMQEQRGPKRKPNPVIDINITFKESVDGAKKDVAYERFDKCSSCFGDCGKPSTRQCTTCNGQGRFTQSRGELVMVVSCPACRGLGREFDDCTKCNGEGLEKKSVTNSIKLPFGIRDGQIIKASGGGNFLGKQRLIFGGVTDAYGDAILRIHVEKDPDMDLDPSGQHVVSDINLTLLEALKGKNVKVRTLKGNLTLKIRPGAKNGQNIVAKGYGTGGMGNHIFKVNVEYPKDTKKIIRFLENQE